jgi:predicted DNA-binding transcriptional regulator YafY
MPVNKDALNRIRIIDQMLANPLGNYSTEDILRRVNGACGDRQREVSLRMIQKDINAIEEQFGKKVVREMGYGGRRIVRYEDPSSPIFSQQLTDEEAAIMHEALKMLGRLDGLENLQWLDSLRKRLNERIDDRALPIISFSYNELLRMQPKMLGRLFSAISRKVAIDVVYQRFGAEPRRIVLSPYQLKQYNDRWFLLGCPAETEEFPYNPEFIINLALDRILDFTECPDDYRELGIDLKARFDEIVGVTYNPNTETEEILLAVSDAAIPYIETKPIHITQMAYPEDEQAKLRKKYPQLKDHTFYSIECRPNRELTNTLSSYQDQMYVIEPITMREQMLERIKAMEIIYKGL